MNGTEFDAYVPLARLALGDGYDGTRRSRWTEPLARLLEAASRGVGQLSISECPLDSDAPQEFFSVTNGMVLLPRNARYWQEVRERLERLHARPAVHFPDESVATALDAIMPHVCEHGANGTVLFDNSAQRLAAAAFIDAPIGVITGGPGTGKTTSAAAMLAIRKRLDPSFPSEKVLLCAPTGKAACRLAESITGAAARLHVSATEREFLRAIVPQTLHRALQWGPKPPERGGPFNRGPNHPLDQELVLVDEASMVDLFLIAHLLRALPPQASLLLLGDSDQLESVEAGGVLAELVNRGSVRPTPSQIAHRAARLGPGAAVPDTRFAPLPTDDGPLPGLVVSLRHSFRARQSPWILELGAIAKPGAKTSVAQFLSCCHENEPHIRLHTNRRALLSVCRQSWSDAHRITREWSLSRLPDDTTIAAVLRRFQLLCGDNAQVERANRLGVVGLWEDSLRRHGLALPHGCPVLITQNRTVLGLSNGDLGIAIGVAAGHPAQVVVFPGVPSPIPIVQLPTHQPAFALTIHKSQGSEWERVAIDLPNESEVLDRNLLYTAISRSSGTLDIYADSERALAAILTGQS